MTPRLPTKIVACFVVLFALALPARAEEPDETRGEVLDMSPESRAPWGLRYLSAPLVSVVRGKDYMYAPREVTIETTPAGAYLDIFYVRSGFQKRFEQAEAPLVVILPSRLEAGSRDSFTVRAFAEGFRQKELTFELSSKIDAITLDLQPLPNSLYGVSHRYFGGRTTISFLTKESLAFRVQEAGDGYGVILTETSISENAMAGVRDIVSPLIADSYSQQLGEDLMVKLVVHEGGPSLEVRSRQSYDAPRELYAFTVDLVPSGSAAGRVERAIEALGLLSHSDISGCALVYDDALRAGLDPGSLARALRPDGSFTDRYLRAAMRRLGAISASGSVEFVDGTELRPETPIELEMAMGNARGAKGFLALLRGFVAKLEREEMNRREGLRSLLAPESGSAEFEERLTKAIAAERACLGSG